MSSRYRKVTISISTDELNLMEDYITVDFGGDSNTKEKCRNAALKVWGRIVKEFDGPSNTDDADSLLRLISDRIQNNAEIVEYVGSEADLNIEKCMEIIKEDLARYSINKK